MDSFKMPLKTLISCVTVWPSVFNIFDCYKPTSIVLVQLCTAPLNQSLCYGALEIIVKLLLLLLLLLLSLLLFSISMIPRYFGKKMLGNGRSGHYSWQSSWSCGATRYYYYNQWEMACRVHCTGCICQTLKWWSRRLAQGSTNMLMDCITLRW